MANEKPDYPTKRAFHQRCLYLVDMTKRFIIGAAVATSLAAIMAISGQVSRELENRVYAPRNQEPPRIVECLSQAEPYTSPIGLVGILVGGLFTVSGVLTKKDFESWAERAYDDDFWEKKR